MPNDIVEVFVMLGAPAGPILNPISGSLTSVQLVRINSWHREGFSGGRQAHPAHQKLKQCHSADSGEWCRIAMSTWRPYIIHWFGYLFVRVVWWSGLEEWCGRLVWWNGPGDWSGELVCDICLGE